MENIPPIYYTPPFYYTTNLLPPSLTAILLHLQNYYTHIFSRDRPTGELVESLLLCAA